MKTVWKRVLAMFLAVIVISGFAPIGALAEMDWPTLPDGAVSSWVNDGIGALKSAALWLSKRLHGLSLQSNATCYSGSCGENVKWFLNMDSRTYELYIYGTGTMQDYSDSSPAPWPVSNVPPHVFINIGHGVSNIGNYAFYDLHYNKNYSFNSCTVSISDSVTSIGDHAFSDCTCLRDVTIPDSVTMIGDSAFYGCNLWSVTIPDSVTTIGCSAFANCTSLVNVTIPDSVTILADGVFSGAYSICSVIIPNGVTKIGDASFAGCTSLSSVTIPGSVTEIGDFAFYGCGHLSTVCYDGTQQSDITIGKNNTSLTNSSWFFHKHNEQTETEVRDIVEATCIANGYSGNVYYVPCGVRKQAGEELPALGHDFSTWETVIEPTSEADGLEQRICTRCGTTEERAVIFHAFSDWSVVREATIFAEGEESRTCELCGMIETRSIPKLPLPPITMESEITLHTDETAQLHPVLEIDGEQQIATGTFTVADGGRVVEVDENGTIYARKPGATTVSFTTAEGAVTQCLVNVVGYLNGVFTYADEAMTILLSCDCSVQGTMSVPDGVTVIGENAFSCCENVTEVILPQSLTEIGEGAFAECIGLEKMSIPGSVKKIGDYAFEYCVSLREVTLENGAETIGDYAFSIAPLTHVHIPRSVKSIGIAALACGEYDMDTDAIYPVLQEITVDADSPYFTAVDGVLYTKDMTELVQYPNDSPDTTCIIPDGVTKVREYAFVLEHHLQTIVFPASILPTDDLLGLKNTSGWWQEDNPVCTAYVPGEAHWAQSSEIEDCILISQMTGISIQTPPAKTAYTLGEAFDPTGLAVDATYDNGETLPLPYESQTDVTEFFDLGSQTVNVSYGGCSTSFTVNVQNGADTPMIVASTAVVGSSAGRLVKVTVDIQNNPGVIATRLQIGYDPQQLKLVRVDNGTVFGDASYLPGGDLNTIPYTVLWSDDTARENVTANGTTATLTFEVQPTATAGDTAVTLRCDGGSTFNADLQPVRLYTIDGVVNIVDCTPADANEDGEINLRDSVMITRYLAGGWGLTINEINADVNGDGDVDLKDVVLIRRFLAGGWDVTLI